MTRIIYRFHPLGLGDENVAGSRHGSLEADFSAWSAALRHRIERNNDDLVSGGANGKTSDLGESESADEEEEDDSDEDYSASEGEPEGKTISS